MAIIAQTAFNTTIVLIPASDFLIYGAIPGQYSVAVRLTDGIAGLTDLNGVDDSANFPVPIGDQIRFTLDSNGAAENGAIIGSLAIRAVYSQESAGDYLIGRPIISGNVEVPDAGDIEWTITGLGIFDSTTMTFNTDPNTGLAWDLANILSYSFGIRVDAYSGGSPLTYFDFAQFGVTIVYTPTALVGFVTPASVSSLAAGQSITIKGDNFFSPSSLCIVSIGGLLATNIVVVDQFTITCDTPTLNIGQNDILVQFTVTTPPDADNIWDNNLFFLTGANGLVASDTPPPPVDIEITGSGGIEIGQGDVDTPLVLSADVSGMYILVPGRHFDRVYSRNTAIDQTQDVAIPTPFVKTGYFGA